VNRELLIEFLSQVLPTLDIPKMMEIVVSQHMVFGFSADAQLNSFVNLDPLVAHQVELFRVEEREHNYPGASSHKEYLFRGSVEMESVLPLKRKWSLVNHLSKNFELLDRVKEIEKDFDLRLFLWYEKCKKYLYPIYKLIFKDSECDHI